MIRALTVVILLFAATTGSAENSDIRRYTAEYHAKAELQTVLKMVNLAMPAPGVTINRDPAACYPSSPGCIEVTCSFLSHLECDDIDEVRGVAAACRGSYNGLCLQEMCRHLNRFDCDELSEIEKLAQACIGNIDGQCVKAVCARLGNFGCDQTEDLIEVAAQCGGR